MTSRFAPARMPFEDAARESYETLEDAESGESVPLRELAACIIERAGNMPLPMVIDRLKGLGYSLRKKTQNSPYEVFPPEADRRQT